MSTLSNLEQNEVYKLWVMLRQTNDAIVKVRQRELRKLKKHGVTCEQSGVLIAIYHLDEDATAAELSRWLLRESNTMTILLRSMEAKGLIKRTPYPDKKNIMKVTLTKKGYETYCHISKLGIVNDIICKLSVTKRKQLWSILEILRDQALESLGADRDYYHDLFDRITCSSLDLI